MAKVESGIRVVIDLVKALNAHDADAVKSCLSDDCVFEDASPAPDGTRYQGIAAVVEHFRRRFAESPHLAWDVEELTGAGARCTLRWKYAKDHQTAPSLGRRGVILFEIRQNRVCSMSSYVKGYE